ncbi:hypothetical protein RB195_009664 [Necator americanus]|uniref:Uncharacterized protein n=1 Tax=Necator americanus TaxID=51031 RepID=A0ABR1CUB4_NECAM
MSRRYTATAFSHHYHQRTSSTMSTQLRRRIGVSPKHLIRTLNLCEEDVKENFPDFLPTAADDDLLEYAELQDSHHESLFTKLRKLEDLNNEWAL